MEKHGMGKGKCGVKFCKGELCNPNAAARLNNSGAYQQDVEVKRTWGDYARKAKPPYKIKRKTAQKLLNSVGIALAFGTMYAAVALFAPAFAPAAGLACLYFGLATIWNKVRGKRTGPKAKDFKGRPDHRHIPARQAYRKRKRRTRGFVNNIKTAGRYVGFWYGLSVLTPVAPLAAGVILMGVGARFLYKDIQWNRAENRKAEMRQRRAEERKANKPERT